MANGDDFGFGFDWNGDGKVSFFESMMTYDILNGSAKQGQGGSGLHRGTQNGQQGIHARRPDPSIGAFYSFTNRHPFLFFILIMTAVCVLWSVAYFLLNQDLIAAAILYCVVAYGLFFGLLFYGLHRSEKAYRKEIERLSREAENEKIACGFPVSQANGEQTPPRR